MYAQTTDQHLFYLHVKRSHGNRTYESSARRIAAANEMDDHHFYLGALNNNAARYAGCETEAGFYPEPEDSLAGLKDAVQDSLRRLVLEITQKCLEYWGSQKDPRRMLDPDRFKAKVKGWKSIQVFRDALGSEWYRLAEREHRSRHPAVDRRERMGTGYFGASESFVSGVKVAPDQDQARFRTRRG